MSSHASYRGDPAHDGPMHPSKESQWRNQTNYSQASSELDEHDDFRRRSYEDEITGLTRSSQPPEQRELRQSSSYSQMNGHISPEDPPALPALQENGVLEENDNLEPISADDPTSYELVQPAQGEIAEAYSLERRSQAIFSRDHLQVIFSDPTQLLKFTSFLGVNRPQSVPLLIHYLDALKALRAIHYANAICEGLEPIAGVEFSQKKLDHFMSKELENRASTAFDLLVKEELPAYITHQYIQIVSASIQSRITGMLAPHLREASEGLAEVFCLTDPSRTDNPIVFASEEFNRTTQYGMSYVLGRNCRFLQGPWTNPLSVRRLKDAIAAGRQHQEVFLNYRRDGSPFMNLLMIAPLCDSRGTIRYFIGAQVDVSGLVKECADLPSLARLVELQARGEDAPQHHKPDPLKDDELRELSEMLNQAELSTIKTYGGRMHREVDDDDTMSVMNGKEPRLLLRDPNTMLPQSGQSLSGMLSGCYQHYLLVRPYPSLRILFASPSQRIPGILQSPLLSKIGGSNRVRDELTAALAEGRGVTAKVRWVSSARDLESNGGNGGRNKWIHCTPLVGSTGQIGVWMVIIVDVERQGAGWAVNGTGGARAHGKQAPPVPPTPPSEVRERTRAYSTTSRGVRSSVGGGGAARSEPWEAGDEAGVGTGRTYTMTTSDGRSVANGNVVNGSVVNGGRNMNTNTGSYGYGHYGDDGYNAGGDYTHQSPWKRHGSASESGVGSPSLSSLRFD